MEAKGRRIGWFVSVAAMTLSALPGVASAADGGTIYFSGGIVAPPFDVSSAAASAALMGMTTRTSRTASAVTVTLKAPRGVASGVDIALMVKDGATLRTDVAALDMMETRFVDPTGHVSAPRVDGHYRVGRAGGALSLSPKSDNASSAPRPVMVVLSYN